MPPDGEHVYTRKTRMTHCLSNVGLMVNFRWKEAENFRINDERESYSQPSVGVRAVSYSVGSFVPMDD